MKRKITSALISVYHKEGLDNIIRCLQKNRVKIYSTGGTFDYIKNLNIDCTKVEDITGYPSIFDGRVKTLHPKIFGGILSIRDNSNHQKEAKDFDIPNIDLVIVDLYPFEETIAKGSDEVEIIEKIDIGGISLIRAAAKNFNDILVVSSSKQYDELYSLLEENSCNTNIEIRKKFAKEAFGVSSHYDSAIFNWFDNNNSSELRISLTDSVHLRYGENPHQNAKFFGKLDDFFIQLHGKEISYNNLLDCDAAVNLINDFKDTTVAILKHNNACGLASRENLCEAWKAALAGDHISAYGGVIISNRIIDINTALEINKIFFEVIIAPNYSKEALELLTQKKNRIILILKNTQVQPTQIRTVLNGFLFQERDLSTETTKNFKIVTNLQPTNSQTNDLIFANKIVKHTKSNAIVLAKNNQLIASGTGQTSRVDALLQAIEKAKKFKFSLQGAVMASDAFFPFEDCVKIATAEGIKAVIQPGGSIRDNESINFCNEHDVAMVFTEVRHFKH
ncbi:MAG: bifunctional phosphoribosylaminoimidazolecarboxamide formyltransferase/IMP cyclohydrolase [Bacteroidales bacterium]|jgi:phosphoribosylaminoimidazolecarboxamide formyltransferase/IMP cyclohydrolase|nr:bifunctional phosphoribosylaminoimidazolecarboxamide formyltransferase/IMP cyclohydrolase [Bacteroidales bacterium]